MMVDGTCFSIETTNEIETCAKYYRSICYPVIVHWCVFLHTSLSSIRVVCYLARSNIQCYCIIQIAVGNQHILLVAFKLFVKILSVKGQQKLQIKNNPQKNVLINWKFQKVVQLKCQFIKYFQSHGNPHMLCPQHPSLLWQIRCIFCKYHWDNIVI